MRRARAGRYLENVERNERESRDPPRYRQAHAAALYASAGETGELIVEWLQRERVVELIFGEGMHDQLVRRCVELLCFLALKDALDARLLELARRPPPNQRRMLSARRRRQP
jgi:hypothetical protein